MQEFFARARVLVTDYSSIAFNAAYLERPVVYYQFDADDVLEGGHVGRRGYFDYRRDGFGPVADSQDEAVGATSRRLANGPAPGPEYQARIERDFTAARRRLLRARRRARAAHREPPSRPPAGSHPGGAMSHAARAAHPIPSPSSAAASPATTSTGASTPSTSSGSRGPDHQPELDDRVDVAADQDEPWKPVKEMKRLRTVERRLRPVPRDPRPAAAPSSGRTPDTLDFFGDVHFGVLRRPTAATSPTTGGGSRRPTSTLRIRDAGDRRSSLQDDADGYFALWTEAMDRFAGVRRRALSPQPRGGPLRVQRAPGDEARSAGAGPVGRSGQGGTTRQRVLVAAQRTRPKLLRVGVHRPRRRVVHLVHRAPLGTLRRPLHDGLLPPVPLRAEPPVAAQRPPGRAGGARGRRRPGRLSPGPRGAGPLAQPGQADLRGRHPSPRRGLRRLLGRSTGTVPERPPLESGEDHRLLAALRDELDEATFERVAQLPQSADEHVAWIRSVWEPKIALRLSGAARA